jgi:hypothetical protein
MLKRKLRDRVLLTNKGAVMMYPYPVHPSNYLSGKVEPPKQVDLYPPVSPVSTARPPEDPIDLAALKDEIKLILRYHKAPDTIMTRLDTAIAGCSQSIAVKCLTAELARFNAQIKDQPISQSVKVPVYNSDGKPLSRQAIHKRMLKLRQQQQNSQGVSDGQAA